MLKLNKKINRLGAYTSATLATAVMAGAESAEAASFNDVAARIVNQTSNLSGVITTLGYIVGLVFAVLGLLKIKAHVENPSQTPIKEGAIKILIAGCLFSVPAVAEATQDLLGTSGTGVDAQKMQKISTFNSVK